MGLPSQRALHKFQPKPAARRPRQFSGFTQRLTDFIVKANPHSRGDFRREAHKPCIRKVIGRAGFTCRWAA